ncbi:trihelix transcription factor ASIL2-like isoform X1 [Cucurbita maxima]|uniref:Trihelix transcription factor ASIL2-like isoform X1 n=1 Tax=Cucurbita maxima TaxID=3661 RepID=A0A6J1IU51_CUCMA|nr:trihelix transcription factor ASIL2-like isoform X1 [Cucurbita maxima]
MGDLNDSLTPSSGHSRPMPVREDCWSEEATSTLVDVWGRRFVELNRGNLRQKDWQDVAEAVNALHGHSKKTHRTDVQCKNRIDTIKKKYKIEKARVSASNGSVTSSWPFYDRLDGLIGSNFSQKKPSTSMSQSPPMARPLSYRKAPSSGTANAVSVAIPQKRPLAAVDDGFFRRNYSAMAAAAAATEAEEDEEEEEAEAEAEAEAEERGSEDEEGEGEGMRRLAKAIERFGKMYERVEAEKLRQMVELEKQRMQFAKDLEVQRMQMFTETQVQLERIKRGKKSGSNDIYG